MFLDIREHHKICECPRDPSDSLPYVTAPTSFTQNVNAAVASSSAPTSLPVRSQTGRCGVVPIPAPLMFVTPQSTTAQEQEPHVDANEIDQPQTQASDAITLSLPTSRINIIDYSMSNAWFPGHVGGVSFAKIPSTTGNTSKPKRDRVVCGVDFQVPDVRSVLNRPEESECLAFGRRQQEQKVNEYVYETYDPEKASMHRGLGMEIGSDAGPADVDAFTPASTAIRSDTSDPRKCPRCLEREALIRLERKKAEEHSRMMLDRGLRSLGQDIGYNWDQDDEEEEEEYEEGEGENGEGEAENDEGMQDMDVTGLNIDLDWIDKAIVKALTNQSNNNPITSFGDDLPCGVLGFDFEDPVDPNQPIRYVERNRRYYDKSRIGVECTGVGDILLSGEVSFFFFFFLRVNV